MADTNPATPEQTIRKRAYEIYLSRIGAGDELSDWLQAERELMSSTGQEPAASKLQEPQRSVPQRVPKKTRAGVAA